MFVGFDSQDIAPPASWPSIRMVGQPHSPMSKGVESPLVASVMCVSQQLEMACHFFCTVDVLFVSNETFERIRRQLQSHLARCVAASQTNTAQNAKTLVVCAYANSDPFGKLASGLKGIDTCQVPKVQLILQATHTHSGPSTRAIFGGAAHDDYVSFLEKTVVKTCLGAYNKLSKCVKEYTNTGVDKSTRVSKASPFSFYCGQVCPWVSTR